MRLLDRIVAIFAPPPAEGESSGTFAGGPPGSRSPHALFVFIPTTDGAVRSGGTSESAPGAARPHIDLRILQERLSRAMNLQHAGRFEGVEPADGGIMLVFSGPNTDRLAAVTLPVLRSAGLPSGTMVTRRYGGPGAREAHRPLRA